MIGRDEAIARGIGCASMLDALQLGFLYDLARVAPDGAAAEAGVHKGGSLATWSAARVGRGRIIAVDNFYNRPANAPQEKRVARFLASMARMGIPCELIECDSWLGPGRIGERLAFCFVDACHGDEGISRDVPAYTGAMMPGGIACFHDYGTRKCPAVKRRVDEWNATARWEVVGFAGSVIALRCPYEVGSRTTTN